MKKVTLVIGLVLVSMSIFGQKTQTTYGFKGGVNYSKYTPDQQINGISILEYNRRFGFYAGGYVNFEFSKVLKLQPELFFALQGSDASSTIEFRTSPNEIPTIEELKTRSIESTISLPVMLQLYPVDRFYFELGPQIGFILDRNEKVTDDPFVQFGTPLGIDRNCSSCDTFDFGIALGLGYGITEKVRISTRYFAGLIKRDDTIKSSVFSLGLGCQL